VLVTITTITTVRQGKRNYKHDVAFHLIKIHIFININTTFYTDKVNWRGHKSSNGLHTVQRHLWLQFTLIEDNERKRIVELRGNLLKTSALRGLSWLTKTVLTSGYMLVFKQRTSWKQFFYNFFRSKTPLYFTNRKLCKYPARPLSQSIRYRSLSWKCATDQLTDWPTVWLSTESSDGNWL